MAMPTAALQPPCVWVAQTPSEDESFLTGMGREPWASGFPGLELVVTHKQRVC